MQSFKTVLYESKGEFEEKHSKFLGFLLPCMSEEEATAIIEKFRSRYWDAKHCVYAYALSDNNITRFSDDGEPHGTAAKPILEVIEGAELKNVILIVVRYFGGVLLGTGGLVRAYTAAAKGAVLNAEIYEMVPCTVFGTQCEYNMISTINSIIENVGGKVLNTEYNEKVSLTCYIKNTDIDEFNKQIKEKFAGKVEFKAENEKMLPIKKGN